MLKFVVLFALVFVSAQAGKWDRFATFEDALAHEEANYDFDLFQKVGGLEDVSVLALLTCSFY